MLTLHQAHKSRSAGAHPKIGLAVAGGGPLGAIYELGALRALDESLDGLKLHELDVYVGISVGAFIAASLANRISTAELCRIFNGDRNAGIHFRPEQFLRPAYREYIERAIRLPAIMTNSLLRLIRERSRFSVSELIGEMGQLVPSGIFDNKSIHKFMEAAFIETGHSNDFRELDARLYVVSVDLDSGAAVRFGSEGFDHVPISQAVQASAALPGLYPPVKIDDHYYVDGALRRTLHASAALDEGVDLLIGINPLVPFDAGENPQNSGIPAQKLIKGGLPLILSQTFRALIQSRMKIGFKKYHRSHENADLLLMEPDRDDQDIFFTNIFSYSSRNALCEHAYQATRKDLLDRTGDLEPLLEKHGIKLRLDLLQDSSRTLGYSLNPKFSSQADIATKLSDVLDELDDAIGRA